MYLTERILQVGLEYFSENDIRFEILDKLTCHKLIQKARWGNNNVVCPHCYNDKTHVFYDGIRFKCAGCRKQFTATVGTFMHNSSIHIGKWIYALILWKSDNISSVRLSKEIGVTQKTAWNMIKRFKNDVFSC